jgi:hypothetical protein
MTADTNVMNFSIPDGALNKLECFSCQVFVQATLMFASKAEAFEHLTHFTNQGPVSWTKAHAWLQLYLLSNSSLSRIWFGSHFVVPLKSDLDVQQTHLRGQFVEQ